MLIPEALRTQILDDLGPVLEGPGWAAALQGFLGGNGNFPYPAPALRAQVLEEIAHGPAQLAAQMMRDVMSTDWSPQLSSSAAAPLLYVHGIMPSDLGRLREVRPDAFVGAVAEGGHYMSLEVPDQINATIDRFITLAFATEFSQRGRPVSRARGGQPCSTTCERPLSVAPGLSGRGRRR